MTQLFPPFTVSSIKDKHGCILMEQSRTIPTMEAVASVNSQQNLAGSYNPHTLINNLEVLNIVCRYCISCSFWEKIQHTLLQLIKIPPF